MPSDNRMQSEQLYFCLYEPLSDTFQEIRGTLQELHFDTNEKGVTVVWKPER